MWGTKWHYSVLGLQTAPSGSLVCVLACDLQLGVHESRAWLPFAKWGQSALAGGRRVQAAPSWGWSKAWLDLHQWWPFHPTLQCFLKYLIILTKV